MNSLKVWHGTFIAGIESFNPLSHFGTELQAYRIIVASAALDGTSGEPVLYKCYLSFEQSELLHVGDIGSPNLQAIFLMYCRALGQKETFRIKQREILQMGGDPNDPIWITWINEIAKKQGHKLLSYDNKVEGNGLSYCVLDNQVIKEITHSQLTWEEVIKPYEASKNEPHGFTELESNKMDKFLASLRLAIPNKSLKQDK